MIGNEPAFPADEIIYAPERIIIPKPEPCGAERNKVIAEVMAIMDSEHVRLNDNCVCPMCKARRRIEALKERT